MKTLAKNRLIPLPILGKLGYLNQCDNTSIHLFWGQFVSISQCYFFHKVF